MNVVAMYLRLSIEDEGDKDESNSITNQRRMIKEYIRSNPDFEDYQIKEFCDDGYSGTNMERPGIQTLLEEVKAGRIACVIVKDMSRFARDYIELGTYMNQIFPFMGVRFIAINDHYDSNSHKGSTVEIDTAFKTFLYDLYSKDVSEKVKASFKNKLENGEYVFGQAPFGYEKDPDKKNTIRVNEAEAAIVKHIFQLSVEGNSAVAIAKILFEENCPTAHQMRKPKLVRKDRVVTWNESQIRKLLTNRFYLGEMAFGKTKRQVGSKKSIPIPEEEWSVIKDHHTPLVDEATFCNTTLTIAGKRKKNTRPKHPLVDKLICGGCKYPMIFKPLTEKNKHQRFECRMHAKLQIEDCCTNFNPTVLEELVLQSLNKELLWMSDLADGKNRLLEAQKAIMTKLKEQLRSSKEESRKLQKQKDRAYEKYTAGKTSSQKYQLEAQKIDEKVLKLQEKTEDLNEQLNQMEDEYYTEVDSVKKLVRYSHIESLTQEIVDTFIKAIYVYHDKRIEIEWTFTDAFQNLECIAQQ